MSLYQSWIDCNNKIKELQKEKLELEKQIYIENRSKLDQKHEGSVSIKNDGFKLTVIKKLKYDVDQDLADTIGFCFSKKYTLDTKAYRLLDSDKKKTVDEAITVSIAKPSFKVERNED